jgi:putative ABC transport system permease protein
VRTDPAQVTEVQAVLARTASPAHPEEVAVGRPSDALAARAAAQAAYSALFVGLGAVALLVGGVGIANVMFVSVLERRSEIGLRRALGATRGHIGIQFLAESALLSLLGGAVGVAIGAAVTIGYASIHHWTVVVPPVAVWGGLASALVLGVVAGLYPALRAARLAPAVALRTV